MTTNNLIKTLAESSDAFSTGLASDDATIIYHVDLHQLQVIAEAYHQAKCAESDAKDKLKIAIDALQAECGNRCNAEYNPCADKQALEKIGEV